MPPKKLAADGAPKARKPRAPKQRPPGPPGWTNAQWAADVERRRNETRGRAEREKKCNAKRAAADEQARLISINFSQQRVGQFPGPWPTQGMIGTPPSSASANSLATAMFQDTYVVGMAGFTPSPPALDGATYEGISPALRRGPLSFSNPGMPAPNEPVMHEMITSGSMAAASSPGFFTQEEARATEAVASRGAVDDQNGGAEDDDEEDEQTYRDQDVHRQEILWPLSAASSSASTSTPAAATTADADASPPDAAPDEAPDGNADEPVIL